MTKLPPYLKKGDTIGIICPAGYMPAERIQTCIAVLQDWGYRVKTGETVGGPSQNYFSGDDDTRLNDLQQMLDDREIKAILCARGGYGVSRIVERVNYKKFRKRPKWIIGYSDITVLHTHILSNYRIATLHAPMAAAFLDDQYKNPYVQSLRMALAGEPARYTCAGHELNIPGKASGIIAGGNLALLTHCIGTASELDTRNKILFIEDVGEQLYNVDRMMNQLSRSGKLKKLAGLVVGGFSDMQDTERPFGKHVYEIIHHWVKDARYPVCYNFPVSHENENFALKVGVKYRLQVNENEVILDEV